jgi:Domain of unknown function (DUF4395)
MSVFQFGEIRPEYQVPVVNERVVRAGAGILFFFALITFMNAFLLGNFQPTRVFIVVFLIDFALRIFVNPRFSPSLIVGQWMVNNQTPEWSGAPQKRFAWAIGFALALVMFFAMVVNNIVGPINMIVCSLCLVLMFFETSFGICVGCKIYNWFNKEKAQLCPGGVCEIPVLKTGKPTITQFTTVIIFGLVIAGASQWVYSTGTQAPRLGKATSTKTAEPQSAREIERCKVPRFAKAIGHEDMWKLHNNCQ